MRAILCTEFADPPRLSVAAQDCPAPSAGQVRVRVQAAAVSFMDLLMVQGRYQMRPPLPFVPGTDAAGVIDAVGPDVTGLQPGNRVICSDWTGAWAEQRLVAESQITPVPGGLDLETACTVRYAYGTAHYALVECARLQPGETVFVSGAAGGVGLATVDLARHLGARVLAGVSSPERAAVALSRGAEQVIVYGPGDLKAQLMALTGGRGVDIGVDQVGGEVFGGLSRAMAWGGRLLPIGFTSGSIPSLPANLPLLKNYALVGAFWGAWSQRHPEPSARADRQLLAWIRAGQLRPLVSEVLALEQAAEALHRLGTRAVQGRLVLRVV
ncbi:NADPH:quinone oxidoreductase family protein [Pelomonas aquatica]|jgi:NADPH2:quinone reductase|uniref:NADPH:quinone oxidoreductase family protein n=1 Tax=Pelomonas aquatica TaxID=431058 RepID=A0A9X4LNH4_9BURK|nr:NADPH:quinone oxidoreductase family protein [Pelomonas aquatica]MCY4756214.1 NADPH:quinone oxidoreductase family protein [Pelomonas aquatica]MDG0863498.1 NADPH:quinone oxidoreductase family protein [Pelomonas aquatica]